MTTTTTATDKEIEMKEPFSFLDGNWYCKECRIAPSRSVGPQRQKSPWQKYKRVGRKNGDRREKLLKGTNTERVNNLLDFLP